MSLEHEEPLDNETADGPAPQANPVENGSHEVDEAPIIAMNGAPLRNIFGHPSESGIFIRNPYPVESIHREASGAMNTSQQGPSADIGSARLGNGDTERSPSALNPPQLRKGKRLFRPTTGQAPRPNRRKPSNKEG